MCYGSITNNRTADSPPTLVRQRYSHPYGDTVVHMKQFKNYIQDQFQNQQLGLNSKTQNQSTTEQYSQDPSLARLQNSAQQMGTPIDLWL